MRVILSYDVELWPQAHKADPAGLAGNVAASYYGGEAGRWGLLEQLDLIGTYGMKAVCFVEALSSLVVGEDHLKRICDEIQMRGHEVQLHLHPEWLLFSDKPALRALAARKLSALDLASQTSLMELGLDMLHRAGATLVSAHRAGGFRANLDTLRAAARAGLDFDSSYNASYLGDGGCEIDLGAVQIGPREVEGVWTFPVGNIRTAGGGWRHMQVCAMANAEMRAGLAALRDAGSDFATIVSHSFELISRDRTRPNPVLVRRFRQMLDDLHADRTIRLVGFNDLDPDDIDEAAWSRAPAAIGAIPTWRRYVEQALCRIYE